MTTIDEILAAVQSLPSDVCGRLIPLIWEQVAPKDWPAPSPAWMAEARRRSELIDSGDMVAEDWHVVQERARRAVDEFCPRCHD